MQRRKSRQSTFAPCSVDIEYAGDSAKFEHILKDNTKGQQGTSNINFAMELRNSKNATSFDAPRPWQFPTKRVFHPKYIYEREQETINSSLKEYSTSFKDVSPVRNQEIAQCLLDKHFGVYQNSFWSQELRNGHLDKGTKSTKNAKPHLPSLA